MGAELDKWALDFVRQYVPILFVLGYGVFRLLSKKNAEKYFNIIFNWWSERLTTDKILNSDLFTNKQILINRIERLDFENKKKTDLAKILLKNKLESILSNSTEIINTSDIGKLNKSQLTELVSENIKNIIKTYENDTREDFKYYFSAENVSGNSAAKKACAVFTIMYNDDDFGFKKLRNANIKLLFIFVETIPMSKSSNLSIIDHLVNMYHCAMISALDDITVAFEKLNGRLSSEIN